jgi:hypothetical protein
VSALVLGSADAEGLGVAAELAGRFEHLFVLVLVEAPHETAFPPGELHWQRSSLGIGGTLRATTGKWDFDGAAFVLGALLARWGSGYSFDESSVRVDLGVGLEATASLRLGRGFSVIGALSGVVWPLTQQIAVQGLAGTFVLPTFQFFAGLGIGYDFVH